MNIKNMLVIAAGVAGSLSLMTGAHAVAIVPTAPGLTVIPAPLTASATGSLLAQQTLNLNGVDNMGVTQFTGTLLEQVYREGGGNLSFAYTLNNGNTYNDSLGRLTVAKFGSFVTAVGQSGTSATSVDYSTSGGGKVSFNFGGTGIPEGGSSGFLEVTTNAKYFTFGNANVLDDGTAAVGGYQPSSTPEASSMLPFGFVGMGLLGLIAARRKQSRA